MALGVTDAQQRLVPAMARKWKQINKFVEVLAHAVEAAVAPDNEVVSDDGDSDGTPAGGNAPVAIAPSSKATRSSATAGRKTYLAVGDDIERAPSIGAKTAQRLGDGRRGRGRLQGTTRTRDQIRKRCSLFRLILILFGICHIARLYLRSR